MNSKDLKNKKSSYDKNLKECLKNGYKAMSPINQRLAEESVKSDNDALALAEQNLRSVKLSDS